MQVRVEIVRFVDGYQPGVVEARLRDARGREWVFIDKLPIFTAEPLDSHSEYPQPGAIACEVVGRWQDERGQEICTIDTERPDAVEASGGVSRFDVLAELVTPR